MRDIPFNRPALAGREFEYIQGAIDSLQLSGNGRFTARCHHILEDVLRAPKVLLTTSCTHALEMTALLTGIGPDDECIMPSFTFVSTVNAFVLRGARPVFVDIRPDTLNIDEARIEQAITGRTRAIVVVHYAGVGCEMDSILEIARRRGIPVIEDNAHGLFGRYRGRPLGTFGSMAALSFHETKNVICGEGGAIVLNRPDDIERAEIIREKGTDRSRFFRGQVDKYTWVDVGSSYPPSEILAAFLCAQLEARDAIQARRAALWNRYRTELADWAARSGAHLPTVPPECDHPAHLFYVLVATEDLRDALIRHLKDRGIGAVFHYQPLHLSDMGRRFGGRAGDCPVTEQVSSRLVRLPLYGSLTDDEQSYVIASIREFPA